MENRIIRKSGYLFDAIAGRQAPERREAGEEHLHNESMADFSCAGRSCARAASPPELRPRPEPVHTGWKISSNSPDAAGENLLIEWYNV